MRYCDVGGGRVRYLTCSRGKILLVYLNRNNGPTGTWEMFFFFFQTVTYIKERKKNNKGRERTNLKSISLLVKEWIE